MTSVQNVPGLKRAALVTGLAYAGLAVTGMLGYLVFRAQLYVPGDATATAGNPSLRRDWPGSALPSTWRRS